MLAVAKKPRINATISGLGAEYIVKILKASVPSVSISDDDEEVVYSDESEWFNSIELTPADNLRIRRSNKGFTQQQLAEKTGIAASHISAMERGKRVIGAKSAMLISKALGCDVEEFITV